MGKPKDRSEAYEELKSFSGRTHQVLTGITLYHKESETILTEVDITNVTFRSLTENELQWYLSIQKSGKMSLALTEYRKKANALSVVLMGSYSSVMGLPITLFYGMLSKLNYKFDKFPVA